MKYFNCMNIILFALQIYGKSSNMQGVLSIRERGRDCTSTPLPYTLFYLLLDFTFYLILPSTCLLEALEVGVEETLSSDEGGKAVREDVALYLGA